MTPFLIICAYLVVLIALGVVSNFFLKKTQDDFFLASRGVGAFMLFMSLFGTTMTAFAMVGSSGESFQSGIGVYGLMASWSGIVHSLCFFLVGIKIWALGKRHGYVTQIQFFRDRFESRRIGLVLFPIIAGMMIPYLLVGILGLGAVMSKSTVGALPNLFATSDPTTNGAIPPWLGMGVICAVVLIYVFVGGVRSTLWINAFQNILFLVVGVVTLFVIADRLGGAANATRAVAERNPSKLKRTVDPKDQARYEQQLAGYQKSLATPASQPASAARPASQSATAPVVRPRPPVKPEGIEQFYFLTYAFIPLSVAMFPHLFQYYLTARSAKSFRLSVIMHPIFILVLWLPCVMLGVWATSALNASGKPIVPPTIDPNGVLAVFVKNLTGEVLGGLMAASILATNSLDAQFLCLGAMFTNDIVAHHYGRQRFTDRQLVFLGRAFVVGVVVVSYVLSLAFYGTRGVFHLGTWCFAGYASLSPLLIASLYWKRTTKAGAYASVIASGLTWWWFFYDSNYGADTHYTVFGMHPVAPITLAATAALVLVSLVTRPPGAPTLARFFRPAPARA